jgi:4,5-dihydroxyphthalate decarboxylase
MANVRVVPLPWFGAHWENERALFGPDPWPYGLGEANRKTLETLIRYAHEQGMIASPPPVDALFVPDCM